MARPKARKDTPLSRYWKEELQHWNQNEFIVETKSLPDMKALGPSSLAQTAYMFGQIHEKFFKKAPYSPVVSVWKLKSRFWYPYALKELDAFKSQDLANALNGLCLLREPIPENFLKAFFKAAERKRADFQPIHFARMFYGAGKLGIAMPSKIIDAAGHKLEYYSPKHLSQTIYGLARSGEQLPPAFLDSFCDVAQRKHGGMTTDELTDTFWALAIVSVINPKHQKSIDLAGQLRDRLKDKELSPKQSHACKHACLRLFPQEASRFSILGHREFSSQSEKLFLKHLLKSGFSPEESLRKIPEIGTVVDYSFICGKNHILMEFDGPFHFLHHNENNAYNGPTRLMTALVSQARPDSVLVRITHADAAILSDPSTPEPLKDLKNILRTQQAGAFRLRIEDKGVSLEPILAYAIQHGSKRPRSKATPLTVLQR